MVIGIQVFELPKISVMCLVATYLVSAVSFEVDVFQKSYVRLQENYNLRCIK